MAKFNVYIQRSVDLTVEVEAASKQEAKDRYRSGRIVFDSDNHDEIIDVEALDD